MKPILPVLLLACVPAAAATATPATATIKATITMRDPGALEVSYQIPPSCAVLDFRNEDMQPETVATLRSDWRAADDCTEFDGRQIRRKNPSCSTLRLRVPATQRPADRVYPWAYPVEKGLYAHTGAYALTNACGPVDWTFSVPGGSVVVDGVLAAGSASRTSVQGGGDWMPTVLVQQTFPPGTARRVHASSQFSPQTLALLDSTVDGVGKELERELPGLSVTVPFIVAAPSDHPSNYWGDVANRTIMRLAFPPPPGPAQEILLHRFITHEMAHLTQPRDWNDSWQDESATLGEGGAEFLRVVTATRLGWFDPAGFGGELETAVNSCLIAVDGKSWKGLNNRGWALNPYHCGLTFYAIGLSSKPSAASPLLRLRDYYRKAMRGERTDFPRELECGDAQACQPRWLPRLAGDEPLERVLQDYARHPGALFRVTSEWGPAMVKPMAFRHLAHLMAADCKGGVSMYHETASARIGAGPACGVLRENMVIVRAEGLPLFEDANAVKASVKACGSTGKTVLELQDGRSITLACNGRAVSVPSLLFKVDLEQAQALLR